MALLFDPFLKSAEEGFIILLCGSQGTVHNELSVCLAKHAAVVNNVIPTLFPILIMIWQDMGERSAAQPLLSTSLIPHCD